MKHVSNILIFLLFLLPFNVYPQNNELPKFKPDPSITKGSLPNGMSYRFGANTTSKGRICFSLIQKMDGRMEESKLVTIARERFSAAGFPSSNKTNRDYDIEGFLARNGMLPDEEGYITAVPGSIRFTFDSFSSALPETVLDSTLMAIFSIAQAAAEQGQTSSSQEIEIAGDFDKKTMAAKLNSMSILCMNVNGPAPEHHYVWNPSARDDNIRVEGDAISRVIVQWRGARTPRDLMETVLPVISSKLAGELGWVLRSRLYSAFRENGLYTSVDFRHHRSADGIGDELLTLEVNCLRTYNEEAKAIITKELDRLYTYGIDDVEYTYARDAYRYRWMMDSRTFRPSNKSITSRCASTFLYGASLADSRQQMKFAYRELPDSVQTRLFNNYMFRMLQQTSRKDSTLTSGSKLVDRKVTDSHITAFNPQYSLKAPKDRIEPVTGGLTWKFRNGVNVIYKQMDTKGILYYEYAVRGGREYADKDYFNCLDGVDEESFSNYKASYGIDMTLELKPADVCLKGKVPSENTEKMLQVISALTGQRENERVFAPSNYKLIVMVGDLEPEAIRKLMSSYCVSFRSGGDWIPGKVFLEQEEDEIDSRKFLMKNLTVPLDVTTYNLALSEVCRHLLDCTLGESFSGCGVRFFHTQNYVGFPSYLYRVSFGTANVPLEHFSTYDRHITEDEADRRMQDLLEHLAGVPVPQERLKVFKSMAKHEFASYRATPDYFIEIAMNRYMNNKNMYENFEKVIDSVKAGDICGFFSKTADAALPAF